MLAESIGSLSLMRSKTVIIYTHLHCGKLGYKMLQDNQVGSIQDCTVGRHTFFQIRMPCGNLTNKLHALFRINGNIVTDVRTKHRWLFHRNTGKKSHLVGFHDFVGEPTISFAVLVTAPCVRVVRVGHWRTTQNTPSFWTELGR